VQLNNFIYNKVLKVSPASRSYKCGEGEIVTFLQVDSLKIDTTFGFLATAFVIPFQIAAYSYLLFNYLGISYAFGLGLLIFFLIINFFLQKKLKVIHKLMLKKKDARMKIFGETLNALKIFKLYAWEDKFLDKIEEARKEEIKVYERNFRIYNITNTILWSAPVLVAVVSIGAYQYLSELMDAADVLTFMTVFNTIQEPIRDLPYFMTNVDETFVSIGRIEKFMKQEEVIESNVEYNEKHSIEQGIAIKVENGNFSWGANLVNLSQHSIDRSRQSLTRQKLLRASLNRSRDKIASNADLITVLKNINIEIKKGDLIGIIGEVGSGKSSLLQAILNNMIIEDKREHKTRLILNGSVAYVAQIPWIQNDSLKNNVLFNTPMDEDKYDQSLDYAELKPDIEQLIGGDMTEIGEKGINLSGGQKARVAIARALYANRDIYLFDDPISALDAHVGQKVMERCITGLLKEKTRILVTHAVQYFHLMDKIIFMDEGEIKWQGTFKELSGTRLFKEYTASLEQQENQNMEKRRSSVSSGEKPKIRFDNSTTKKPGELVEIIPRNENEEILNIEIEEGNGEEIDKNDEELLIEEEAKHEIRLDPVEPSQEDINRMKHDK
jgi:ATP-binding cassette subfamily C (CFTR/MRP) protein 1